MSDSQRNFQDSMAKLTHVLKGQQTLIMNVLREYGQASGHSGRLDLSGFMSPQEQKQDVTPEEVDPIALNLSEGAQEKPPIDIQENVVEVEPPVVPEVHVEETPEPVEPGLVFTPQEEPPKVIDEKSEEGFGAEIISVIKSVVLNEVRKAMEGKRAESMVNVNGEALELGKFVQQVKQEWVALREKLDQAQEIAENVPFLLEQKVSDAIEEQRKAEQEIERKMSEFELWVTEQKTKIDTERGQIELIVQKMKEEGADWIYRFEGQMKAARDEVILRMENEVKKAANVNSTVDRVMEELRNRDRAREQEFTRKNQERADQILDDSRQRLQEMDNKIKTKLIEYEMKMSSTFAPLRKAQQQEMDRLQERLDKLETALHLK